jgi:hypothetical protein
VTVSGDDIADGLNAVSYAETVYVYVWFDVIEGSVNDGAVVDAT